MSDEQFMAEIKHVWGAVSDSQRNVGKLSEDVASLIAENIVARLNGVEQAIDAFKSVLDMNQSLIARIDALEAEMGARMSATESASFANEAAIAGVRDAVNRNASELGAAVSRTSRIAETVHKLETDVARSDANLLRIVNGTKSEITNLKEAVLGRIDDRSNLVLAMEIVREKVERLENGVR